MILRRHTPRSHVEVAGGTLTRSTLLRFTPHDGEDIPHVLIFIPSGQGDRLSYRLTLPDEEARRLCWWLIQQGFDE